MNKNIICTICKKALENGERIVTLGEKGSEGINRASEDRGDSIRTVSGQQVHNDCRRDYCLQQNVSCARKLENVESENSLRSLVRKVESCFSFKTDCFFCGTAVHFDHERKRSQEAFNVSTIETKNTVLKICSERGDAWAEVVRARIMHVHDLPAADAVYHQTCSVNFRTKKQIPRIYASEQPDHKKGKMGRPQDETRSEVFLKLIRFLRENDNEQITIGDLEKKMQEYLGDAGEATYSHRHIKTKLKEHFGNQIIITEINGKSNVVTFRTTAESILDEFHGMNQQNIDPETEKINIITTAAKLIKTDIS